ncbi:hypothetical protein C8F01DRAFT_1366913 [Mycena amicta]|nr:hypothetical protein C8F01DRAFT_1366913 [Mycena amicta]
MEVTTIPSLVALGGNRVLEKGSGDAIGDQDERITRLWAATTTNFGLDIHGNASSGDSLLTQPPEHSAEEVEVERRSRAGVRPSQVDEFVDEETPLRLITFDVPQGFVYREGDHMEVFPENDPAIGAAVNPKSVAALLVGRGPITLRQLLVYFADLAGPLQRSSIQVLASFLSRGDTKYKVVHEELTVTGAADAATFAEKNRNFSRLLANHPVLVQVLTVQRLLVVLRATQSRRYSVASSPLANARMARLCVGVEDYRVVAADHAGLCSSFLKRLSIGHTVWARPRASQESFHLPEDPSVPVTMVAAGTGVSAFLGFLEHRRAQGFKVPEHGGLAPFRLYYGVSYHDMPRLRSIIAKYVEDGIVTVEAVYSEEDAPRRFAQQLLTRDALKVWVDLSNGGRVYVCGSAVRVGEGVRRSLPVMSIAEQVGGVADPVAWLSGLRKEGRYSEDVFG